MDRTVMIAATNEWTTVTCGGATYYVFPTPSIAFDVQVRPNGAEVPALLCGEKALMLEPMRTVEDMMGFLPVLALGGAGGWDAKPIGERGFEAFVSEAAAAYSKARNPRMLRTEAALAVGVDDEIDKLRKVTGKSLVFTRQ
jgi:hypothetical protein